MSPASAKATRLIDLVVAVGAAAPDLKAQIDLGGGEFVRRGCRVLWASRFPSRRAARDLLNACCAGLFKLGLAVAVLQPVGQLFLDLLAVLRLRVKAQGVRPLEARLALAPDAPIGITQMIIEDGIFRAQFDGLFQLLDRVVVFAELVVCAQPRLST